MLTIATGMHRHRGGFVRTVNLDLERIEFDPQLGRGPVGRHAVPVGFHFHLAEVGTPGQVEGEARCDAVLEIEAELLILLVDGVVASLPPPLRSTSDMGTGSWCSNSRPA